MSSNSHDWLAGLSVDRGHPTPLYMQLKSGLQAAIVGGLRTGELAAGDPVPSENDLQGLLGVSSITVRRALNELEAEGLIQRIQGRGSFVTGQRRLELSLERLFSLTTFSSEQGRLLSQRLLAADQITAGDAIAHELALMPGDPVAQLARLRLVDEVPLLIETSHLPLTLFPDLLDIYDERASLYDLLRTRYGRSPQHAHDVLIPALTGEAEADILGIEPGLPTIIVERTAYTADNTPVEFTRSTFRGDMCRFTIDLSSTTLDER